MNIREDEHEDVKKATDAKVFPVFPPSYWKPQVETTHILLTSFLFLCAMAEGKSQHRYQ